MEVGWLYLHFLDRELLTTSALYGALSFRRIQDDFILSLLSITEPAYVSTSVLFESDYAFELFRQYGAIFSRQDILRIAGAHEHLGGFILQKRDDYSMDRDRYFRYFTDVWKDVEDRAPTLAVKSQDTTQFLHRRVGQRLVALPGTLREEHPDARAIRLRSLVQRLTSTLEGSLNAPVTASLFEPVFRACAVQDSLRYHVSLQISLAYVESYVTDYGGNIPTGLKCGLHVFAGLSQTPDIHRLDVWREIYTSLGVYPRILTASADDLVRIRDLAAHARFVRATRRVLEREESTASIERGGAAGGCDAWRVAQHLTRRVPRCSFDESTSFVGFVEDALHRAAGDLEEQASAGTGGEAPVEKRARSREETFYLDCERGILKSTDGWELALDERVARVLLALAAEIPGLGRLGRLSNDAIASLYTGEQRTWETTEAAKITYQFTRILRRTLSRAGIRDRNAIVRRLRGKGVAMGNAMGPSSSAGKIGGGTLSRPAQGRSRDVFRRDRRRLKHPEGPPPMGTRPQA